MHVLVSDFWVTLPVARVTRLRGATAREVAAAISSFPDSAPAVLTYTPKNTGSLSEAVASALSRLEDIALGLWPTWLPGAEVLSSNGTGMRAARALAQQLASASDHSAPFVAELAQQAIAGKKVSRLPAEVRALELARLVARTLKRRQAALLVDLPEKLTDREAQTLADMCDWLAQQSRMGIWLAGPEHESFDKFNVVQIALESNRRDAERRSAEEPIEPATHHPINAGRPHPGSKAETALENALAGCDWANGRTWNQTFRPHTLANPVRVDLLWTEERCVVEIDGPDHCEVFKFEADRRRDVLLQLQGFAVLRFTNEQVLGDVAAVCSQIRQFILFRRAAKQTGDRCG